MNETTTMDMKTVSRITPPVLLPKLKRVAAYARVSMGKDAMLHSLAAQVSYYSDLIQRNPEWEYAGVYAEMLTPSLIQMHPTLDTTEEAAEPSVTIQAVDTLQLIDPGDYANGDDQCVYAESWYAVFECEDGYDMMIHGAK